MAVCGIERLRRISEALRAGGDRPTVSAAAHEVCAAVNEGLDERPWRLQAASIPVQFRLVRNGSPAATIRRMPEADLAVLRRELLEFVELAGELDGTSAAESPATYRTKPKEGGANHGS